MACKTVNLITNNCENSYFIQWQLGERGLEDEDEFRTEVNRFEKFFPSIKNQFDN
jgi:hypothetical protein